MRKDDFTITPLSDGGASSGAEAGPSALSSESPERRRRLLVLLVISVLAGAGVGWVCGGATGVRDGVSAGARPGYATLAERAPGKTGVETARLLEEVRGLRAQLEQFRHAVETQRQGEQTSARLKDISTRLEKLERAAADAVPVGSVGRPASAGGPRRQQNANAH